MKLRPSLLLAVSFILMVGMSSCVRNYICHCTIKYSGQPGLPDSVIQEYNIKDTKSKAKTECAANSATYDNNGIHTEENCYLY